MSTINTNNTTSLPDEMLFKVFKNLPLIDLLNCEQTCTEWDVIISDLFDHNREQFGLTLEYGQHIFSVKCSTDDLKIQLAANKLFNNICFEEFINNLSMKVIDDIFPRIVYMNNQELKYQRENVEKNDKTTLRLSHPIFEKEMFILFENYGFSLLFSKRFVKEYLENQNEQMFYYTCLFFIDCVGDDKDLAPYAVSWLETFLDISFKGVFLNYIDTDYKNTPTEIAHLSYIERFLSGINTDNNIKTRKGELVPACLTKPFTRIEEMFNNLKNDYENNKELCIERIKSELDLPQNNK